MADSVREGAKVFHHRQSHGEEEDDNEDHQGEEKEKIIRPSGLINHIISNLGSNKLEEKEEKKEDREGSNAVEGKGGVLLHHLMSNYLVPVLSPEGGSGAPPETKNREEEEKEQAVKSEEKGNGPGIIDNIVSHFPTSLPDDAAPTTDEATILIHSIVRD